MSSPTQITQGLLKAAFECAEQLLGSTENRPLARKITNEVGKVSYENNLNDLFLVGLQQTFPECSVLKEHKRIDLCVIDRGGIVAAIETKGMVSNSHKGDRIRLSTDVFGINVKLNRKTSSVKADMAGISDKLPVEMVIPRFELFVPVIYELYREGGTEQDWYAERKPWVTLPRFRQIRKNMKDDLIEWFNCEDPAFRLVHAAESVELRGANELWKRQSQRKYRDYRSLEAYVSFYTFARYVE